jgi:hypothetical protein
VDYLYTAEPSLKRLPEECLDHFFSLLNDNSVKVKGVLNRVPALMEFPGNTSPVVPMYPFNVFLRIGQYNRPLSQDDLPERSERVIASLKSASSETGFSSVEGGGFGERSCSFPRMILFRSLKGWYVSGSGRISLDAIAGSLPFIIANTG